MMGSIIPQPQDTNPTIQEMIAMALQMEIEMRPSVKELLTILSNEYVNQQIHEEIITR